MDKDLLELLDEIARITFSIKEEYNKLPYLLINKDYMPNFEDNIKKIIERLIELRIEEDSAYSLIENNLGLICKALNYLTSRENDKMDEEAKLCFNRIKNNFRILMYLNPIEEIDYVKETFKNDSKFSLLTSHGVSDEDAVIFTRKFSFAFDTSITHRFITTVNEEIKKSSPSDLVKLIQIKLNASFSSGNELEEDLFKSLFSTVKNNLSEEISNSFGIDPKLKDSYLNMLAINAIHKNLSILSRLVPSLDATKLILEFKTYILYLSNTNLQILKNNILKMNFSSSIIQILLIQAIDLSDITKRIHNSDTTQKTF